MRMIEHLERQVTQAGLVGSSHATDCRISEDSGHGSLCETEGPEALGPSTAGMMHSVPVSGIQVLK